MSLTSYRTAPPRVTTSVAGLRMRLACALARMHACVACRLASGSRRHALAHRVHDAGRLTAPRKSCAAGFPGGAWACMGGCLRGRSDRPTRRRSAPDQSFRIGCTLPAKSATDRPHRRCRTELQVPRRGPYSSFPRVVNPPREHILPMPMRLCNEGICRHLPPGPAAGGTRWRPRVAQSPTRQAGDKK